MNDSPITVLLIDDDPKYVSVAEHLLKRFQGKNFHLIWKKNGSEGIQELKSNPSIHVVLMDYFLTGSNGVEIAKQLAEQHIEVPIIFLTMHKNFQVAVEAMQYGVHDYLVKEEAGDAVLPQTILAVLERVGIQKQIADVEKQQLIAKRRADAIQELIVTICHEFNNPLAAIKISSDIISRQHLGEDEQKLLSEFMRNVGIVEKEIVKLRNMHWDMDASKR